jgi:hypothetical protein
VPDVVAPLVAEVPVWADLVELLESEGVDVEALCAIVNPNPKIAIAPR